MRLPSWIRVHLAALRTLLVLTVLLGALYPLAVAGIAQLPGLKDRADGSMVGAAGAGAVSVGSALIGQPFTDKDGNPLAQYFQSRPSAAGNGNGYDPTKTSASNLGPESVVDVLPDPATKGDQGTPSLLTQVCSRSAAVGAFEGVNGARPFCTADGVGAVLAVFHAAGAAGTITKVVSLNQPCPAAPFLPSYRDVPVTCAQHGQDYSQGVITPIRGDVPADPAVPSDAVTASGSGLDPQISPQYATLQAARIAKVRGAPISAVTSLIGQETTGRVLGFIGEPAVNVLKLNLALNQQYPYHP